MNHLHDQTVEDQEIQLGKVNANYLGPNLLLKGCKLMLRTTAKALTATETTIEDSQIVAAQKLTGFRWYHVWFRRCRFSGTFSGCEFGHWPDDPPSAGGIEECDFSAAILDGCRFLDCDTSRIRFPTWPCFTLLDPVGNLSSLSSRTWPGSTGIIVNTLKSSPPETSAVVLDSSQVVKKLGSSQDELCAFLKKLDNVLM